MYNLSEKIRYDRQGDSRPVEIFREKTCIDAGRAEDATLENMLQILSRSLFKAGTTVAVWPKWAGMSSSAGRRLEAEPVGAGWSVSRKVAGRGISPGLRRSVMDVPWNG
jgi:hypothetical protein